MQLLLDTHALVWFVAGSARLPEAVLPKIARDFDAVCDRAGFVPLPIKAAHATAAGAFALEHRDPFDRILAAQAMIEDMSIVWIDAKLDIFRTKRVWA